MKTFSRAAFLIVPLLLGLVLAPAASAVKTCYDCHQKQKQLYTSRKFIHQPTKEENCESCHKRHGFAQTLVLTATTNDLCYSCHADLKAEFDKASVHFPVSDGKCWDCHDPHASDKKGLLRAAPEGLDDPSACFMCHKAELDSSLHAAVPHPPFNELECTRCHAPHASEHTGLLTAPANDLCGSCHSPADSRMTAAHGARHVAGLACTECHSGHAAGRKGLLSDRTHEPFASGDCETCHSLPDDRGRVAFAEGVSPSDGCVTCHSDVAEKANLAHPHAAMTGDNCTDCHRPHSSRFGSLLTAPQEELCGQCHSEVLTGKGLTPHLPAVLGQCSSCHEVHGSANAALLARSEADLCLSCHSDFEAARDSAATVHAAADDCRQCHASHEGKTAAILRKDPSELCANCHAVDDAALGALSGHQPYLTSDCAACHSPHYSTAPHLVRGEGADACVGCHADVQGRLGMTVPHPPAADDCRSCHVPHYGANAPHLLAAHEKDVCATCHDYDDLKVTAAYVHAPARAGDCSGCHNPHGAMQENLVTGRMQRAVVDGRVVSQLPRLTGLSSDLCYTCHDDLAEKFRRPGVHAPVAAGNCDACHAPHGSANPGFVTAPAPELCAACHAVDAGLQAAHDGFALDSANCLDCHNPHISEQPKLVRARLHPPFAEKSCDLCHAKGPNGEAALSGDMASVCSACHEKVGESAGLAHQHPPFAAGECGACHGVHAADYDKMLKAEGGALCTGCHADVRTQMDLAVQHRPFADGQCLDCHRPHASAFTALKNKPAETFCLACHADLEQQIKNGQPHAPVVSGECTACHQPHAGATASLLTVSKENLCGSCHDASAGEMTAAHSGFAVAAADCQNCHEAHAAPKGGGGLLMPRAHAPFTAGQCGSCHVGKQPARLIAPVKTLCLTCHEDFARTLDRPVVHAPVGDDNGCTGCHGPHVGYTGALQKKQGVAVCLTCHNTPEFSGKFKHQAAFEDCRTCHEVHAGDYKRLLSTPDIMELCMTCHADAKETHYHPMGAGVIDPRTKQDLNCVGCHSPHSSEYDKILLGDRDRKLCITCHSLSH